MIKNKIKTLGDFNNWKGVIGLYLNSKELRTLKPLGINKSMTISQVYEILK